MNNTILTISLLTLLTLTNIALVLAYRKICQLKRCIQLDTAAQVYTIKKIIKFFSDAHRDPFDSFPLVEWETMGETIDRRKEGIK